MRDLADLIIEQNSKCKSLNEICSNFITILNKDIIKAISPEQYDILKDVGDLLEKKLSIFAESSKVKEDN